MSADDPKVSTPPLVIPANVKAKLKNPFGLGLPASFFSALGIGKRLAGPPTPVVMSANDLAQERTSLARDRTFWAADRTLMGWIRTALSMISFGFTIGKIGKTLKDVEVKTVRGMRMVGVDSIAQLLVILGTVALAIAAIQYSRRVHRLVEEGHPREFSLSFVIALVLCLVGSFAFTSLALNI